MGPVIMNHHVGYLFMYYHVCRLCLPPLRSHLDSHDYITHTLPMHMYPRSLKVPSHPPNIGNIGIPVDTPEGLE